MVSGSFKKGEVFAVADRPYEGRETGVYEDLKKNRSVYGSIYEFDLRNYLTIPQYWNCIGGGEKDR